MHYGALRLAALGVIVKITLRTLLVALAASLLVSLLPAQSTVPQSYTLTVSSAMALEAMSTGSAVEAKVSRFGPREFVDVIEVDPARRVVQRRSIVTPSEAEPCAWPPLLHAEGVTVVLAGGMGRGAQQNMLNNGVEVVIGVPPAEPDVLVAAYLAGEIRSGVNACEGEGSHAHDHGHHHEGGNCQCAH